MTSGVLVSTLPVTGEENRRRCHTVLDERTQNPPSNDVFVVAPRPSDVDGVCTALSGLDGGRLVNGQVAVHVLMGDGEARVSAVIVHQQAAGFDGFSYDQGEVAGVKTNGRVDPKD